MALVSTFYRLHMEDGSEFNTNCANLRTALRRADVPNNGHTIGWQKFDINTGREIERDGEIPSNVW